MGAGRRLRHPRAAARPARRRTRPRPLRRPRRQGRATGQGRLRRHRGRERPRSRCPRLRENLARLGYAADIVEADAATYRPDTPVDGVLLDAPCSATGTFRRHPEVLLRTPDIAGRVELQRKLIVNAVGLPQAGRHPRLLRLLARARGGRGSGRVGRRKPASASSPSPSPPTKSAVLPPPSRPSGTIRTHPALTVPGEAGGTLDGFFVARFRKLPGVTISRGLSGDESRSEDVGLANMMRFLARRVATWGWPTSAATMPLVRWIWTGPANEDILAGAHRVPAHRPRIGARDDGGPLPPRLKAHRYPRRLALLRSTSITPTGSTISTPSPGCATSATPAATRSAASPAS